MALLDWTEKSADVLQQGGVIGPDERLPWPQTAAMGVQHVIAMFGATVLAPILMVLQSRAVIEILVGRDSGWGAQRRNGGGLTFAEAWRFHRTHVAIGAVTGVLCYWVSVPVLAWMSPVVLGLLLSANLSWWTSKPASARLTRLLATKEDLTPPLILLRAEDARRNPPSPPILTPPRRPRAPEGLQPAA